MTQEWNSFGPTFEQPLYQVVHVEIVVGHGGGRCCFFLTLADALRSTWLALLRGPSPNRLVPLWKHNHFRRRPAREKSVGGGGGRIFSREDGHETGTAATTTHTK